MTYNKATICGEFYAFFKDGCVILLLTIIFLHRLYSASGLPSGSVRDILHVLQA